MTEATSEANIVGPSTANSLLNCADLKKTRYAHEVTVAALSLLLSDAYNQYNEQAG